MGATENYEAIYTDLLIAPNSLIGGAVFNNNLMFSQRGKTSSGADSSQYQNINTSDPMNTSNSFRPNFLLDFEMVKRTLEQEAYIQQLTQIILNQN